jgi:hypothetical protein
LARNAHEACHARAVNVSRFWAVTAFVAIAIISIAVGLWLRANYAPEWMAPDTSQHPPAMRPFAVEADCYSQLARVQRILHGQGLIQNHFTVENWPEGLTPSTTAPFDYAILLLYAPLALFTKYPLDWAGALISPALWIALVVFWMFFRSREFNLAGRAVLLMGSAALPAFLWATACGRPRHQSLILALMAIGLTAEYERWQIELTPKRTWNIFAGIVWGLACWTSLFEPVLIVVCLIVFNLVVRRKENFAFLVSFGIVMLVALLLEGPHIFIPPPEYHEVLLRWLATIAEVQPVNFAGMMQDMTLLLLLLPLIVWKLWSPGGFNKTDVLLVLLTVLLTVLAVLQRRWLYYASLAELFLLVRYFQAAPTRWPRLVVLGLFVAGMADANETEFENRALLPPNQPSPQLVQISQSISGTGGIMAPWWLSPGLLYFSGQPIVSGSSHCGISGIAASAKFFTTTSWADAELILQQRKVRWIVVWDNPAYEFPLLRTSLGMLGLPLVSEDARGNADSTVAQLLLVDHYLPTSIHLRAVTPNLKLYEYTPDGG